MTANVQPTVGTTSTMNAHLPREERRSAAISTGRGDDCSDGGRGALYRSILTAKQRCAWGSRDPAGQGLPVGSV